MAAKKKGAGKDKGKPGRSPTASMVDDGWGDEGEKGDGPDRPTAEPSKPGAPTAGSPSTGKARTLMFGSKDDASDGDEAGDQQADADATEPRPDGDDDANDSALDDDAELIDADSAVEDASAELVGEKPKGTKPPPPPIRRGKTVPPPLKRRPTAPPPPMRSSPPSTPAADPLGAARRRGAPPPPPRKSDRGKGALPPAPSFESEPTAAVDAPARASLDALGPAASVPTPAEPDTSPATDTPGEGTANLGSEQTIVAPSSADVSPGLAQEVPPAEASERLPLAARRGSQPPPRPLEKARSAVSERVTKKGRTLLGGSSSAPIEAPSPRSARDLSEELDARAARLRDKDKVGAAWALVERALLAAYGTSDGRKDARGLLTKAKSTYGKLRPAVSRLRRALLVAGDIEGALRVARDELELAEDDAQRADGHVTIAELAGALGRLDEARDGYMQALGLIADHAAALKGLEVVLAKQDDSQRLVEHLGRVAQLIAPSDGTDGDRALAAWVEVERAALFDRRLSQPDAADLSLRRAVELVPPPGPVRHAWLYHALRHERWEQVLECYVTEATEERDPARAARLLYAAGRVALERLSDRARAVDLFERSLARDKSPCHTTHRAYAEVIRLRELAGEDAAAATARRDRLVLFQRPTRLAHEHGMLARIFERIEQLDGAIWHAEKALECRPDDDQLREQLDRALKQAGNSDRRIAWARYAAQRPRPPHVRVDAMLTAASLATSLGRTDEAISDLRAAWVIDEGNPRVFDALSVLLAPPPLDPDEAKNAGARGVQARISLLQQAADAEKGAARKIALLEKLVSIWEDELGQPRRAMDVLETILAMEPGRHAALLAMQRCAARAHDAQKLVVAITAEAELIGARDPVARRGLWLRAAEVTGRELGDAARAVELVDRALSLKGDDAEGLRAKATWSAHAKRWGDARKALTQLVEVAPPDQLVPLWYEVARLDEVFLKRPADAVAAYEAIAKADGEAQVASEEIARLLSKTGESKRLVALLRRLADKTDETAERASILIHAAEILTAPLRDDPAALDLLQVAARHLLVDRNEDTGASAETPTDTLVDEEPVPSKSGPPRPRLSSVPAIDGDKLSGKGITDPAPLEQAEWIHMRRDARKALGEHYRRWLQLQPPKAVELSLRLALVDALADEAPEEAIVVLEQLVADVPSHAPAQRVLERLYRHTKRWPALVALLNSLAQRSGSRVGRHMALWGVAQLAPALPGEHEQLLQSLTSLTRAEPDDRLAWEMMALQAERVLSQRPRDVEGEPAVDAPAALTSALTALADRTRESRDRAAYHLEIGLLLEQGASADAHKRKALEHYRAALERCSDSVLAARAVVRLGAELRDASASLAGELALADLVVNHVERAEHLCRAAELTERTPTKDASARAIELYERALSDNPDGAAAAVALAERLAGEAGTLVTLFMAALGRAQDPEQRERLAMTVATLCLEELDDAAAGVAAMRRLLAVKPNDADGLMMLAALLAKQGVWLEARDTLNKAATATDDPAQRKVAQLELARLHMGPIDDPMAARAALDAALSLDERDKSTLELLHALAQKTADKELASRTLSSLANLEADPAARVELDLRLADVRRQLGDGEGVVEALCDAVVTAPKENRAWTLLGEMHRQETREGAEGMARAVERIMELATERRVPHDSRWVSTLGLLEVTVLGRIEQGLGRLQQSANALGATPDVGVALARGMSAVGRNAEATQTLRDVLLSQPDQMMKVRELGRTLELWESALATDGRAEERLSVEEVRASLGYVAADRASELRRRPLVSGAPYADVFAGSDLAPLLVPEARSVAVDVRNTLGPFIAKAARFDLGNLGITSRERVGPRDNHPVRMLADTLARALGVQYELYVVPGWNGPVEVAPGDPPAIIFPAAFANLNQGEQAFALARALGYIAIGAPFLQHVPENEVDGFLVALIRVAEPEFGVGEVSREVDDAALSWSGAAKKSVGWLQKRRLDDARMLVAKAGDMLTPTTALHASAHRIGLVLSGNLLCALDYMRRTEDRVSKAAETREGLLSLPESAALIRFALSDESTNLRRRAGVVYMG